MEFNKGIDNDAKAKPLQASEFNSVNSNYEGCEFQIENGVRVTRKQSKKSGRITTFLTSAAAIAVLGAAVAVPSTSAKAEIAEVWATDTEIGYVVNVEKFTDSLKLVVYNDFTRRECELSEGDNEGSVEGLKPQMKYTVAVVTHGAFGEQAVSEKTIYTQKMLPPKITEWRGITYECTCDVDGYFHFTMDFVDELGIWKVFYAALIDEYGNGAQCEFTEDLHGDQVIDVSGGGLMGNTAEFIVMCIENEEEKILYRTQVQI